jgi:hypothetical protein
MNGLEERLKAAEKRILVNNAVTDRQREIIQAHDGDVRVFVDAVKAAEARAEKGEALNQAMMLADKVLLGILAGFGVKAESIEGGIRELETRLASLAAENGELRKALRSIYEINKTVDWVKCESVKYMQASLYHEMRDIAEDALKSSPAPSAPNPGLNEVLEEAANKLEQMQFAHPIDWWKDATKQEVFKQACLDCVNFIRALKTPAPASKCICGYHISEHKCPTINNPIDAVAPADHINIDVGKLVNKPAAEGEKPAGDAASDEIPRRIRLDRMVPAELAIHDAIQKIEELGADPNLTEAIVILSDAQNMVSDFVDGIKKP